MAVSIKVDLRKQFGPVRDQSARPTCLAFAVSDAHAAMRAGWEPLSCEFAFYHAQRRAGRSPAKGALLSDMLATLREEGQPHENGWPYLPKLPEDLSLYTPPNAVGELYGRDAEKPQQDVDRICASLETQTPTIVLTKLTKRFFQPPRDGLIDHVDRDQVFPAPRHAVIAVGYGVTGAQRAVLIRNSWGAGWGQSGYVWLTEQYLIRHMYGLALLKEACDVPNRAFAA